MEADPERVKVESVYREGIECRDVLPAGTHGTNWVLDFSNLDFKRSLIIAEIGGNHEGDLERAYHLARLAANNGADVVKFQTYYADTLVNPKLSPSRHAHFKRFELPRDEWFKLAEFVRSLGVEWMTSIWDYEMVDVLDPILPVYKIGSGDFTNFPMIAKVLSKGKPIILSTGMCDEDDIEATMQFVMERAPGFVEERKLALLQCTAMYDSPDPGQVNLGAMSYLRDKYGVVSGFSNHTLGPTACTVAASMGAKILEVHFTDDKQREFRDHRLSFEPRELRELRETVELISALQGSPSKQVMDLEVDNRQSFRRGIYFRRDLNADHVVSESDLILLRPNVGLDAREYFNVIGKRLQVDVAALQPLEEDFFS